MRLFFYALRPDSGHQDDRQNRFHLSALRMCVVGRGLLDERLFVALVGGWRADADEIGSRVAASSVARCAPAREIARNAEAIATAFAMSSGKPSQDKGFLRVAHPQGAFRADAVRWRPNDKNENPGNAPRAGTPKRPPDARAKGAFIYVRPRKPHSLRDYFSIMLRL